MFQPGEVIIYSGHGVCRVKEVGHPSIPGANPDKLYYKLAPVYEAGDIYIPVDSRIFMNPSWRPTTAPCFLACSKASVPRQKGEEGWGRWTQAI